MDKKRSEMQRSPHTKLGKGAIFTHLESGDKQKSSANPVESHINLHLKFSPWQGLDLK